MHTCKWSEQDFNTAKNSSSIGRAPEVHEEMTFNGASELIFNQVLLFLFIRGVAECLDCTCAFSSSSFCFFFSVAWISCGAAAEAWYIKQSALHSGNSTTYLTARRQKDMQLVGLGCLDLNQGSLLLSLLAKTSIKLDTAQLRILKKTLNY